MAQPAEPCTAPKADRCPSQPAAASSESDRAVHQPCSGCPSLGYGSPLTTFWSLLTLQLEPGNKKSQPCPQFLCLPCAFFEKFTANTPGTFLAFMKTNWLSCSSECTQNFASPGSVTQSVRATHMLLLPPPPGGGPPAATKAAKAATQSAKVTPVADRRRPSVSPPRRDAFAFFHANARPPVASAEVPMLEAPKVTPPPRVCFPLVGWRLLGTLLDPFPVPLI